MSEVLNRIVQQLHNIIPDGPRIRRIPEAIAAPAIADIETNVTPLSNRAGRPFDAWVSGEYATFIYYLSRRAAEVGERTLATRLFLLNKALNGIDLYYEVLMPAHFLIGHTVGMVFAKASYGEWCIFHQGCTVGRLLDARPRLADGVVMYPNSSIIGRCEIGPNTVLSAGVQLINTDTPGNCIVFSGEAGRPVFKPITEIFAHRYYDAAATGLGDRPIGSA